MSIVNDVDVGVYFASWNKPANLKASFSPVHTLILFLVLFPLLLFYLMSTNVDTPLNVFSFICEDVLNSIRRVTAFPKCSSQADCGEDQPRGAGGPVSAHARGKPPT